MEQRLTVDAITPQITEWTCKIKEEQVCIVLYGDDIGRCHKLFELFDTYLISTAKVKGQPMNANGLHFENLIDITFVTESAPIDDEIVTISSITSLSTTVGS
ncbi:hypothetical protein HAX54_029135 [Datura stramonium]|uniref:Uncharacterized protein n=1 Tax=Datura stramonium TaxID=4076 RepID=A0ABS8S9Z9_DATST|nr:hypothetical protein [Datura stramonium]